MQQEGPEAGNIMQAGLAVPARAGTSFPVPYEKATQWHQCTRLPPQHQSPQGECGSPGGREEGAVRAADVSCLLNMSCREDINVGAVS